MSWTGQCQNWTRMICEMRLANMQKGILRNAMQKNSKMRKTSLCKISMLELCWTAGTSRTRSGLIFACISWWRTDRFTTWTVLLDSCLTFLVFFVFFTACRNARIASTVLAIAIPSVCPSICSSVTRRYCVKQLHVARCSLHCQIAKCVLVF